MTPRRKAPEKPKRREYGSGGITQRHTKTCPPAVDGIRPEHDCKGLFIGRIEAGWTPGGNKRRRIQVAGKTRADVEAKLRAKHREIDDNGIPEAGLGRVTVRTWSETWLPMHAAKVRPTTYTTDAGAVRKWIVPTLGRRRLADLNPSDLRALTDAIRRPDPPRYPNGRSSTTALHAHKTLTTMLKAAKVEGHRVDLERLTLVDKPAKAKNDRTAMTVPEALRVLEVIRARDDSARWVSALLNGMRQGESLGLTWEHVDLERRRVDISWQLQSLPYADRKAGTFRVKDGFEARQLTGALHLTRPKTARGLRVIPLVRWLAAALEAERGRWEPNPWGLIWTDTLQDGRRMPIRDGDDRARWHEIQAQAKVAHPSGRPYHLHETRHTAASLLLAMGVDRAVIEAIVGHATLVESYLHVDTDAALAALEKVADRLGLTSGDPRP